MVEQLMETLRGIIMYELPKNAQNKPIVYNREIEGWQFGDTDISGSKSPNIITIHESTNAKKIAFGVQELTHQMKIGLYTMSDNTELTERSLQEMTRLVYEAMLKHYLIWVMTPCPICQKKIFTPEHFTLVHGSLLSSYVTAVLADFTALWNDTHDNIALPTLPDSGVAADAFNRLCIDVWNNVTVSGLTNPQKNNINALDTYNRRFCRLIYDVALSDVQPDTLAKENLKGAAFKITAKELIKVSSYGPDNVPTGVFNLQP